MVGSLRVKALAAAVVCGLAFAGAAHAQQPEAQDTPDKNIARLADRIYALGETSGGDAASWDGAEAFALDGLRKIGATNPALLAQPNAGGETPLIRASYRGFAVVVEELLKYPEVVKNIHLKQNEADAWILANFAARPGMLACNPQIATNAFSFVPLIVTQPYYDNRNPYPKIRAMLEKAGAKADIGAAKALWAKVCKNQALETAKAVADAADMQLAVMGAGRAAVVALMASGKKR